MHASYRPRTQSAQYRDGNCPHRVLAIYDNNYQSADRYTVVFRDLIVDERNELWLGLRAMNSNPQHPQGIGLYAEYPVLEIAAWRDRSRLHACRWRRRLLPRGRRVSCDAARSKTILRIVYCSAARPR